MIRKSDKALLSLFCKEFPSEAETENSRIAGLSKRSSGAVISAVIAVLALSCWLSLGFSTLAYAQEAGLQGTDAQEAATAAALAEAAAVAQGSAQAETLFPIDETHTRPVWVRQFANDSEGAGSSGALATSSATATDPASSATVSAAASSAYSVSGTSGSSAWSSGIERPCLAGEYIATAAGGKLYLLDSATGKTLATADLYGSIAYGYTPMTYVDSCMETAGNSYYAGTLFVPVTRDGTGYVQALRIYDSHSAEPGAVSAGIYEIGQGQLLSPIAYFERGGSAYIATGTWQGDGQSALYVCHRLLEGIGKSSATDTYEIVPASSARWQFESPTGFYNAGALVMGNYLIVGSEDKTGEGNISSGRLLAFDLGRCDSGAEKSADEPVSISLTDKFICQGDIRCTPLISGKYIYFTTTGGYIYSVGFDQTTGQFVSSAAQSACYGSGSVCSPVKASDQETQVIMFTDNSKSTTHLVCVSAEDLTQKLSDTDLGVITKTTPLVVKQKGIYIAYYESYNYPGGIRAAVFNEGLAATADCIDIYTAKRYEGYAASSLIADMDTGSLYYKNDSGSCFCLRYDSGYSYTPWSMTGISGLYVNETNSFGSFAESWTEDSGSIPASPVAGGLTKSRQFVNLWVDTEDPLATVKLSKVSGVSRITGPYTVSGHQRYAIYYSDTFLPAKVKITVTAEDGTTSQSRTITLKRFTDSQYANAQKVRKSTVKSLKAKRLTKKKVKLTWKKVSGATGYKIYRASKKKGKYSCIKTVKGSSAVKATLSCGSGKYYYKVRAYVTYSGYSAYGKYSALVRK